MVDGLTRVLRSLESCSSVSVFSWDAIVEWPDGDLEKLLQSELIQPSESANEIFCHECGNYDSVVLLEDVRVQGKRPYVQCPIAGSYAISPDRLKQWQTTIVGLIRVLQFQLQPRGDLIEIATGRIWRLGAVHFNGAMRHVYLARGLDRKDAPELIDSAGFGDGSLVLTPTRPLSTLTMMGPMVVPLLEIFDWEHDQWRVNLDQVVLGSRPTPESPKPTAKKRSKRSTTIEALTRELMTHIRSAKDHAHVCIEHEREAKLLPRPTQKELAKRIDVTAVTVGRCLKDPEARELQFLWRLADDLHGILEYSSRK